jgi:probable phosphoglycerate mutase
MDSTEILLIRHGETPWNALRRLQGHTDIPLNAEGRRQAKALAYALSNEKLDAVYASDLQRAMQTAGEIARLQGVSTRLEAGFRERCFGAFEGQLYSDLPHLHPEAYANWKSGDPDFVFPPGERQGESVRQFHARDRQSALLRETACRSENRCSSAWRRARMCLPRSKATAVVCTARSDHL